MRFRIIFDKELVSENFVKAWFVVENQQCLTSEIIEKIKETFNIKEHCHVELEDFAIPDSQIFNKIVKEDEIVSFKSGKFSLTDLNNTELAPLTKQKKVNDTKKLYKVANIKESSSDSKEKIQKNKIVSSSDSSPLPEPRKKLKKYISESSSSSSSEVKQQKIKEIAKKAAKKPEKVQIKSIFKKQPEPKFVKKAAFVFNIADFLICNFEELEIGSEILFKTLEIKEDNTPGVSDYKLGKVAELTESIATIQLIREDFQEELNELKEMQVVDELYLENFQVTLEKNMIFDLMKKKKTC